MKNLVIGMIAMIAIMSAVSALSMADLNLAPGECYVFTSGDMIGRKLCFFGTVTVNAGEVVEADIVVEAEPEPEPVVETLVEEVVSNLVVEIPQPQTISNPVVESMPLELEVLVAPVAEPLIADEELEPTVEASDDEKRNKHKKWQKWHEWKGLRHSHRMH